MIQRKMNNITLSVIIPCYNGEKYIKKCIHSIMQQTYKSLEIIVIDDGSTDNSYQICSEIAKDDSRIQVIHQENKGLPATRKIGINISHGFYVTFVDADDWIHPQMYEYMMNGIIQENADIAQCGVCDAFTLPNGQIQLKHRYCSEINNHYQSYDRIGGVLKILDDKEWRSYTPNKIYKKELFKHIEFPVGRFLDEDLSIMHQIFHKAHTSIYFPSEFYYYLQGSVTQVKNDKNKAKKIIDRCNARYERYLFTKEHTEYHPMLTKMHNIFLSVSLAGLRWAIQHPENFSKQDIENIKRRILENPLPTNKQMNEFFSFAKKIEYMLFKSTPSIYQLIVKSLK